MLFDSKELTNEEIMMNPEGQFFPYQMKLQSANEYKLTKEEKLIVQRLRIWSNSTFNSKFIYPPIMYDP